jgi:hypothetical protein
MDWEAKPSYSIWINNVVRGESLSFIAVVIDHNVEQFVVEKLKTTSCVAPSAMVIDGWGRHASSWIRAGRQRTFT